MRMAMMEIIRGSNSTTPEWAKHFLIQGGWISDTVPDVCGASLRFLRTNEPQSELRKVGQKITRVWHAVNISSLQPTRRVLSCLPQKKRDAVAPELPKVRWTGPDGLQDLQWSKVWQLGWNRILESYERIPWGFLLRDISKFFNKKAPLQNHQFTIELGDILWSILMQGS